MNEISSEKAFEIAARLDNSIGGEICAAIAMALDKCMADEVHDNESFVVTIKHGIHATLHCVSSRKGRNDRINKFVLLTKNIEK